MLEIVPADVVMAPRVTMLVVLIDAVMVESCPAVTKAMRLVAASTVPVPAPLAVMVCVPAAVLAMRMTENVPDPSVDVDIVTAPLDS